MGMRRPHNIKKGLINSKNKLIVEAPQVLANTLIIKIPPIIEVILIHIIRYIFLNYA